MYSMSIRQCIVCPQAEVFTEKFTIKSEIQNNKDKVTQNTKLQYIKISLSHKRDFSLRGKQSKNFYFAGQMETLFFTSFVWK